MLVDLLGTWASVLLGESQVKRWSFVERTKLQSLETGIFIPDPSLIHWMLLVKLPN